MAVPGHPHTGLQTVSWLFSGEVEHRDTTGAHALVRPGELNIMTAGSGIAHSEYSTPGTTTLHGAQLWVALPEASRFAEPGFEHYAPEVVEHDGARVRVFLGSLAGRTSPVSTHTALVGAEITVAAGATVTLEVDPAHEHGFLCDTGTVSMGDLSAKPGEILFRPAGAHRLTVRAGTDEPARMLLLGGPPFGEEIVMWWNFVGRSHDEIVDLPGGLAARARAQTRARAAVGLGGRPVRALPRGLGRHPPGTAAAPPAPALPWRRCQRPSDWWS